MDAHVTVFAPAPQLTVTIEQVAGDTELHLHTGSQGIWQSRMIAGLGVPVTLCAVLGGEVGRVLEPLLTTEGVRLRAVWRNAPNGWYVHDRRKGERALIAEDAGPPLGRHELDDLYTLTLAEGLRSEMTLLSGPPAPCLVPPDAYRRLAKDLSGNGGRVAADLSGDHLDSVLDGRPEFVKVSDEEIDPGEDPGKALHRLHDAGAATVVVTRAEQPALALVDGDVQEVRMPRLEVADHRGAGDSMTAGVVSVLAHGGSVEDAIRTGAAAGALNVTRHGLGSGRADAIHELSRRVRLEPVLAA